MKVGMFWGMVRFIFEMFWGLGHFVAGTLCIRSFCLGTFWLGTFCRSTKYAYCGNFVTSFGLLWKLTYVESVAAAYLKGIVSWVWEQLQWNPSDRSEEFCTARAYFTPFWCHFHVLILKKHSVTVSHLTVTLQMMSNSWRSLCEWLSTAGAYFYSLLMTFSCFNSKKAFCGGFSFDSHSANDE
jgi:hypothetical protein